MRRTERILIVEDDRDIALGTMVRLRAAGFATIVRNDGAAAIDTATDETPDAIVLDVRMPSPDGMEVLTELRRRERTRAIPVVMLSASLVDRQRALEAGARFFLSKPYQGATLVEAVERVIEESRHETQGGEPCQSES